jgi:hypothetical protein
MPSCPSQVFFTCSSLVNLVSGSAPAHYSTPLTFVPVGHRFDLPLFSVSTYVLTLRWPVPDIIIKRVLR